MTSEFDNNHNFRTCTLLILALIFSALYYPGYVLEILYLLDMDRNNP